MYAALMDDPTRGLIGSQPPEEPQNTQPGSGEGSARDSERAPARPRHDEGAASRDPKFIGDAMRSLYRSSATSIERGDATRVISRTDSTRPMASTPPPSKQPASSHPPGPRVDVMLWLVLALGLFAIAGVMLSGAL